MLKYRFETFSKEDYRPLVFDPRYPWWCTGFTDKTAIIVAYLPEDESLTTYWDDAHRVDVKTEEITFSDRFPKPDYYETTQTQKDKDIPHGGTGAPCVGISKAG